MHENTLTKSLAAGQWALLNTITQRFLVFGSFFILARLLTPADFGVVALIAIVPTFLDGITTFAFDTAALQRGNMERYLNAIWTFNILRSIGIFTLIFVSAPLVAHFFHIDSAVLAMRFGALSILILNLSNIGQALFFRDFDLRSVYIRDLVFKTTYAIFAIALAFYLKSYWALFLATIGSSISISLATYALHPYRPRLDFHFRVLGELRSFSQWLFAQEMVQQVAHTIQDSLIGRYTSPSALGLFGKAQSLSDAPTAPLVSSINKVSFTSYVRTQESLPHVLEGINKTFEILVSIAVPYLIIILVAGTTLVRIAFGDAWLGMTPLLKILVIEATLDVLVNSLASPIFNAIGKPKTQFLNSGVRAATMVVAMLILVPLFGIWGAAIAALVSVGITACVVIYHLFTKLSIKIERIVESVCVVTFAALLPLPFALYALTLPFFNSIIGFLLLVAISGFLYFAVIIVVGRVYHRGPYKTLELVVRSFLNKSIRPA